jgi:outer membrane receptor protein involved in Fe transport
VNNSNAALDPVNGGDGTRSDNLIIAPWKGDDGTNPDMDVLHGPNTRGSDLLYATQTVREAFAAYSQAVWDINDTFTLTMGIRYASDEVTAEENLARYTETDLAGALGLYTSAFTATPSGGSALYDINVANGGFLTDAAGNVVFDANGQPTPTTRATNGGIPASVSVYRPFYRKDTKTTGRINLDWNINDSAMMYFSATSGYRSGGYNLVFFSSTPDYDPEELMAYEIGYKTQFLNDTLQLNGSFYYYDYTTIHTVATEVSSIGGFSTSVLEAPGAEIYGIEAEALWLATDNLTLGGNFSYTPSKYTEDLFIKDTAGFDKPLSLFPASDQLVNINGNQLLQVPELKYTAFGTYRFPMANGSNLDLSTTYSWVDEVYYSPFQNELEKTEAYARTDLRVNWTSANNQWIVSAFVNNVFDDVGILQILRNEEEEFFRQSAGTTLPRLYGMEFTFMTGA